MFNPYYDYDFMRRWRFKNKKPIRHQQTCPVCDRKLVNTYLRDGKRKCRQGGQIVEAGQKDIGGWWRVYGTRTKSVTHWTPMPDPPGEGV